MDNKKLLVLSDSHGGITLFKAALSWAKKHTPPEGAISAAVFLGDGISDIQAASDAAGFDSNWIIVRGNNDYSFSINNNSSLQDSAVFDFGGHCFYACHGHRHNLYGGYHTLISAAKSSKADVALFGHSHTPFYKKADGVSLVNPGSVSRPRSKAGATFAVIECPEGKPVKVEFFNVGTKGEIAPVKI